MSYRRNVSVSYDVQGSLGGLGLVLVAVFGGGRSVHDILVGGGADWGPPARFEPLLEDRRSPFGTLLDGAVKLGEEVEIDWV